MKKRIARKADKTDWQALAEKRVRHFIRRARAIPKLAAKARAPLWDVAIQVVGAAQIKTLNAKYRRKTYATDVLSFPAPPIFRAHGQLGELVVCLPVLKRQAREQGHPPEKELDVLLVHGLLHLLGFDHEKGARQAAEMLRWESKLLGPRAKAGLISRNA